ncbi:unnamed protein product [Parnassius apollo]|uniref:(apollo) hypothetical protein n=1 Tax=Parnassius apollo TaxID=110799 RepID=A0A8S3Y2V7_PARAO|nr:unnamed protein product [Parnassius apollo]
MFLIALVFLAIFGITFGIPAILPEPPENEVITHNFPFVARSEWRARTPKQKQALQTPVPYVVIHHSYSPPACYEAAQCENAMRSMQDFHMDSRGWWDIGYNFAVGSDGAAYEGRGWGIQGAHALHFNSVSIGICLIGDWTKTESNHLVTMDILTFPPSFLLFSNQNQGLFCPHVGWRAQNQYLCQDSLPPMEQIKTAKSLIAQGVELGYIKPDYKLIGHRQVRDTECPGATLYQNLKTWEHYVSFPATSKDLVHVEELPEHVREILRKKNISAIVEE